MILHKGISALIAAAALGLAAQSASAAAVQITVDGCNNGQNIHTTVTFNFSSGFKSIDSKGKTKKGSELCGGIIFAACNNGPDLTPPPEDHHGDTGTHTGQDGPPAHDWSDNDPDHHENFNDDSDPCTNIHWDCPEPCITGESGIPQLNAVVPTGPVAATPLPSSVWGASALIASLGIVSRLRRKLA